VRTGPAFANQLSDLPTVLRRHSFYTDGCASHPIPAWAHPFLHAAATFAALTHSRELLARQNERPHILRLAEDARLRPPQLQPPLPQLADTFGVVWDWGVAGAGRWPRLNSF
jgi:hypothetical protein